MHYVSSVVGRVFALRWLAPPDTRDLKSLGPELIEARKRVGQPLLSLSILPPEIAVPDLSMRKEMDAFNRIWAETCDTIHVVLGGEGFKHAIIRSVVSALALATAKRGLVQVHRTLDDALEKIREAGEVDTAQLRLRLVNLKMLDGL